MHYRAIILVLASEDILETNHRLSPTDLPVYPFFKKVCEQYMFYANDIKFLFVYGSRTKFEPKEYDIIYDDIEETLAHPCMLKKTLRAYEYIDKNFSYDFLIRTNLNTVWDLEKLKIRLSVLPTTKCLTGTSCRHMIKNVDDSFDHHWIAGVDLLASRDLIKSIIPHSEEILSDKYRPFRDMEDFAITKAIMLYGGLQLPKYIHENANLIVTDQVEGYSIPYRNDIIVTNNTGATSEYHDHYRCRGRGRSRYNDKVVMTRLLKNIYNIDMKV
jgi:hypothetical protein